MRHAIGVPEAHQFRRVGGQAEVAWPHPRNLAGSPARLSHPGLACNGMQAVGRRNTNTRQGRVRALRLAVALLVLTSHAFSQRNDWRFWRASDGFAESFVRSVTAGADGSILVRHGEVGSMTILDGYGLRRVPEMQRGSIVDWGMKGRAYLASNGEIWTVDRGELRRYQSGTWLLEAPPDPAHPMLAAVPAGDDRVLVLFSDRLVTYSPSQHRWSILKYGAETLLGEFTQMVPGFFSDFWITGKAGVARLRFGSDGEGIWTQSDVRKLGLSAANYPMPSAGQDVYISARLAGSSRWAVVRWSTAGLEVVYTGNQDNVMGWRGPDDELWVLDGVSLLRMPSGRPESKQRAGSLSGSVYDVLARPDGSFWLGTANGLVKYSPSIWRTPAPVADLDVPVHSIAEDAQGRLWFSATEYLLELDGAAWRRYPLPLGMRTHDVQPRSLFALADGRILVKARTAEGEDWVLRFDPKNQRFEPLVHPLRRTVTLMVPRRDGTFWVRTKPGDHIEVFDGKTFQPQFDLPPAWKGADVRCILETADGTLWIGGTVGAIEGKNGNFRELKMMDGYAENGAFDIVDLGQGRMAVGGRDTLQYFDGRKWWLWRSGMDRARMITRTRDDALWVASGSGLHRLQNGNWLINGEDEGLLSAAIAVVFEDSRGRVWAGTSRGVSLYHPEADREAPSVGFTPAENMRETGPDGHIRIFFSGVDKWKHTPVDKLLFSYRLDSAGWSPFAENSSATFDRLKAGAHTIRVRGMDRNANIRESSGSFAFQVALPWYRQTGFFANCDGQWPYGHGAPRAGRIELSGAEPLHRGVEQRSNGCGVRQRAQGSVPGEHEPRNQDAHERHHRNDRDGAGTRHQRTAARLLEHRAESVEFPAGFAERNPRFFQGGGGKAGTDSGGFRPGGVRPGCAADPGSKRAGKAPGPGHAPRPRRSAFLIGRRPPAGTDAPEPRRQCG